MKIQKIYRAYLIVTIISLGTLFYSGFATQSFFSKQQDFSSIVTRGETREVVLQACNTLHRPFAVQLFQISSVFTLFMILFGIAFSMYVFQQRRTDRIQSWIIAGTTLCTTVIFFVVQIWEPDFLYSVCK